MKNKAVMLIIFALVLVFAFTATASAATYGEVGTVTTTVKFIESMLSSLGYNVGNVDYRYDYQTAEAVKKFQADAGLPVTGIVNTATYKQIRKSYVAGKVIPIVQPTPQPTPQPQPQPVPTELTIEEAKLLSLINAERISRGLQPFQVDMKLVGTARAKATDMAVYNYFSHTSPRLGTSYEQMVKAGITGYYMLGAENIAFARNVDEAHYNFMHSDGHRRNILDPRHTHIGLGVVSGSAWGKVVVEHFAGK